VTSRPPVRHRSHPSTASPRPSRPEKVGMA
jgi:hypothetical protein